MNKYIIIGAGPVGSHTAYLLAKQGYEVEIYEEHDTIGEPIQCTGILTEAIKDLIEIPEEVIDNTIYNIGVNSQSNKKLNLSIKKGEIILNRTKFDQFLAKKAKKEGVKIFTSHKFINFNGKTAKIKNLKNNQIIHSEFDFLIGADGPNSTIRKLINNDNKVEFYIGTQIKIKIKSKRNIYQTYLGSDFPEFFGWIVPENEGYVRIGLASKKNPKEYMDNFLKRLNLNEEPTCENQGGLIPIYNPQLTVIKNNIAIVGDAATHVKATTGGGIYPGMKACEEIIKQLNKTKTIKNKDLNIHKSLKLHLIARKVLDKFSDKEYDDLIKTCENENVKNILGDFNRDKPIEMGLRLVKADPKLLKYVMKVL